MTAQQQPTLATPYDAEIEKLMAQRESKTVFWRLYAKQNQREGYLRAKAECAPPHAGLLDLLTAYIATRDNRALPGLCVRRWLDETWIPAVRAAIAKAKRAKEKAKP